MKNYDIYKNTIIIYLLFNIKIYIKYIKINKHKYKSFKNKSKLKHRIFNHK